MWTKFMGTGIHEMKCNINIYEITILYVRNENMIFGPNHSNYTDNGQTNFTSCGLLKHLWTGNVLEYIIYFMNSLFNA